MASTQEAMSGHRVREAVLGPRSPRLGETQPRRPRLSPCGTQGGAQAASAARCPPGSRDHEREERGLVRTTARDPAGEVVERIPQGGGGWRQVLEGKGPRRSFLWRLLPWKRREQKANFYRAGAPTWLTCKLQLGL